MKIKKPAQPTHSRPPVTRKSIARPRGTKTCESTRSDPPTIAARQAEPAEILQLAQAALAIIVRTWGDGTITLWNQGAEELYGWTESEALGQVAPVLLQTHLPQPLEDIKAELLRTGHWQGELEQTRRDKSRLVAASRWSLQHDAQGQPVAILEIDGDIKKLQRTQNAIRTRNAQLERSLGEHTAELERTNRALREQIAEREQSEARFEALFQSLPYLSVVFLKRVPDLVLTEYNQAAMTLTQGKIAHLVGKTVQEIYAPRPDILERIERAFAEQTVLQYSAPYRLMTTGRDMYIVATFAYMPPDRVMLHTEDITERERAETALRESEERYRNLFNTIDEGFCIIEMIFDAGGRPADYRFLEINAAFAKQTGLQAAKGRLMRELAPAHEAHWFEIYGRIALTGEPAHFVNEARALNRWYDVYAYRVGKPQDRQVAVLFNDITQHKQAEETLRQRSKELETARAAAENEKRRLEAVMEALPVGVAITDARGGSLQTNRAYEEMWRGPRPPADSVSDYAAYQAWWADTGKPIAPEEWASAQAVLKGVSVVGQVLEILRFDGSHAFVINSASPVYDSYGKIVGSAVAIQDITDLRRAEESLHEAMHRIQNLNADLEQRAGELEVANQELERLAVSLAHDLRLPLVSLQGVARVIAQDYGPQLPPHAHQLFELIRANAAEMDQLSQGLLRLMRVARQTLRRQELDPAEIVRAVLEQLEPECAGRHVEFDVGPLPPCNADPLLVKQVWVDLLANALKFTRPRDLARIEIGARSDGARIAYYVKDNGVGFDMSYATTIFRAFQRFHHPEEWGGTGVGLAVVESIVRRHGGRVCAEGAVDRGATLFFEI